MPRTARIDIPDLLQHVIVRGVNRADIFLDDADRSRFCRRFSKLLIETGTECLAWSLMSNHFHLLLRPRNTRLASLMRRLLTGYAIYFNLRHGRSGHLFQNRYKSLVCEEDSYLLELVRYIHLNPLRAGLVDDLGELDRYPCSGHAVLLGNIVLEGQLTDAVLSYFSKSERQARRLYREFIADGVNMGRREDFVSGRRGGTDGQGLRDERVLGGEDFLESLRTRLEMGKGSRAVEIGEVIERVCAYYGVDPTALRRRTRTARIAEIRSVICCLAVREMGHSGVEVGRRINLERSGVSLAAARGEAIVRANPILLQLLEGERG